MRRALGGSLLVVALLVAWPARAEIYRWVDEHGVVHLDDTLQNVPEAERGDAKVFQARKAAEPAAPASGPTQAAFANGVARELGYTAPDTQSAISILHVVGVYPSAGWNPAAVLTAAIVDEVARATRAAARAHRLPQSEASAEAAVLRVSNGLGVAGPPPIVIAEPEPPPPPNLVVAPNIVVEAPPPANVVVQNVQPAPEAVLTRYGFDPLFNGGVPFAPIIPGRDLGPVPNRIVPLSNPAGHLNGPAVPPLPRPGPFQRPHGF
jgi:Domain of unknown function (DUF4124)